MEICQHQRSTSVVSELTCMHAGQLSRDFRLIRILGLYWHKKVDKEDKEKWVDKTKTRHVAILVVVT